MSFFSVWDLPLSCTVTRIMRANIDTLLSMLFIFRFSLNINYFRNKYLAVFDAIFGNHGINRGEIRHVPSNQDIINTIQENCKNLIDYENNGWKKYYKMVTKPFKEIYDDFSWLFTNYKNE